MTQHFDYIAIGGGSGGIASANRAASHGKKCAIIEAKALGGTCVNVGCVPKKAMWFAGQVAEAFKLAPDYGFATDTPPLDWSRLIQSREAYISRIHASYDRVLAKNNVTVIQGFARFIDKNTVRRIFENFILPATAAIGTFVKGDIKGFAVTQFKLAQ